MALMTQSDLSGRIEVSQESMNLTCTHQQSSLDFLSCMQQMPLNNIYGLHCYVVICHHNPLTINYHLDIARQRAPNDKKPKLSATHLDLCDSFTLIVSQFQC